MLLLLPFEPPYFEAVGLPCTWVGHAAVAETPIGDGKAFRDKYEIADATRVLCLMPGSRKGEVERHMPIFAKTVAMLAAQFPDIAMAVAVPQNVMPFVAPYFKGCPFRAVVMAGEQDKKNAIAASNFAIVKSGTVALEVALAGTPMLVTYKVNALSAWAFRRMSTLKYVSLINIILDKPVIPEFLQELCSPLLLAGAAAYYLQNESARNHQKEQAKLALSTLIPPNGALPSDLAARTVLQLLPR
jgi:lipid-A-disaccharide synthase